MSLNHLFIFSELTPKDHFFYFPHFRGGGRGGSRKCGKIHTFYFIFSLKASLIYIITVKVQSVVELREEVCEILYATAPLTFGIQFSMYQFGELL